MILQHQTLKNYLIEVQAQKYLCRFNPSTGRITVYFCEFLVFLSSWHQFKKNQVTVAEQMAYKMISVFLTFGIFSCCMEPANFFVLLVRPTLPYGPRYHPFCAGRQDMRRPPVYGFGVIFLQSSKDEIDDTPQHRVDVNFVPPSERWKGAHAR